MVERISIVVVGIAIGVLAYHFLLKPEVTERIEVIETITVDTVYVQVTDTLIIQRTDIREVYVRDTVINNLPMPINRFSGLKPTTYGDIAYTGLVAGYFLNMDLTTNFKFPNVTNTVERKVTKTIVHKPKGIYATGGISSDFNPSIGAVYLNDRALLGYEYNLSLKNHALKVGFKVF